jgi:hypothetical protein
MLTPTIDLGNISLIFGSALAGFAVLWGLKKAVFFLSH